MTYSYFELFLKSVKNSIEIKYKQKSSLQLNKYWMTKLNTSLEKEKKKEPPMNLLDQSWSPIPVTREILDSNSILTNLTLNDVIEKNINLK